MPRSNDWILRSYDSNASEPTTITSNNSVETTYSPFDWNADLITEMMSVSEPEPVSMSAISEVEDRTLTSFYNGVEILDKEIKKYDFIVPKKSARSKHRHYGQDSKFYAFVLDSDYVLKGNGDTCSLSMKYYMPVKPTQALLDNMIENVINRYGLDSTVSIIAEKAKGLGLEVPTFKCKICGEEHLYELTRYDGEIYCHSCYEEAFAQCSHCGDTFPRKDVNSDCLCTRCSKRHYILAYHDWRRPKLKFYGGQDTGNRLFMGVESEVDIGGEKNKNAIEVMKIMNGEDDNFICCMHDGSLQSGFELITQPATLRYHTSIMEQYQKAFKFLIDKDYLAHDTATCGLHVHFNRSFYAENEELYISRLLLLNERFWDKLVVFSRRNHRKIEQYAKKIDMSTLDYISRTNKSQNHDYHYYSINLANAHTIEFRMFRGTLNAKTYLATLQLCQNMIKCAKTKTAEDIQRMEFEDLITHKSCKQYWNSLQLKMGTEE